MKKISNKGFVLAETIVVATFMVTIFTVLYSNYFPIMANYEKREYYDDIDSKYIAFWLKYIIQDNAFNFDYKKSATELTIRDRIATNGYAYFTCEAIETDINKANYFNNLSKKNICNRLVKEAGLNLQGTKPGTDTNYCRNGYTADSRPCNGMNDSTLGFVAIITNYQTVSGSVWYNESKNVKGIKTLLGYKDSSYDPALMSGLSDGMIDYIFSLPDYTKEPSNKTARYRLIIELEDNREEDRGFLYKYANIEVSK